MLLYDRRAFLHSTAGLGLAASGLPLLAADAKDSPFKISLAQWSLHKTFFAKKADPADFAKIAKTDYDIHAI